jgi:hypothetical protein
MSVLPDHYDALLQRDEPLASWLIALLPEDAAAPSVSAVLASLERSELEVVGSEVADRCDLDEARWQLDVRLRLRDGCELPVRVWMQPSEKIESLHLEWHYLTAEEAEAAHRSAWSIGVSAVLGDSPLSGFHDHVRVLAAVAPEAVVVLDVIACWPRSGEWMREVAASTVPPSPENLFCVHAVHDDQRTDDRVWLHSHGLLRCNTLELEVLAVPRDHVGLMHQLLSAAATLFIERGPPSPTEPFLVGADLPLVWLPWEDGIHEVSADSPGGADDRDENHAAPSAVLFTPGRKLLGLFGSRYRNPSALVPVLEANPLLYVSDMETERMSLLARERLPRFVSLVERYVGDEESWVFLVKLGFPVDDADTDMEREHLWFQVHGVQTGRVDATLLNEPYGIARMSEGDRDLHELELLSDWSVICQHGKYDPDTVYHLDRLLDPDGEE